MLYKNTCCTFCFWEIRTILVVLLNVIEQGLILYLFSILYYIPKEYFNFTGIDKYFFFF